MGGIGGLLGMGGGASGSGFSAPAGVDPAQLNTAYQQTQSGIKQQQDFVNALNAQNGLGNQSSVFNQLQGVANGTGPNPAKAQLANATGQNVANQAALMAGQRGAGANAGLIARQAAQQGAGIQQNAAGQAAALQAQQSLNAMNSMGNIANTQVAQHQAGLTGLNQNQLQQQANLMGLQANINSANAGLAGQSQGNQSNMFGNLMGGAGTAIGGLFGGGAGDGLAAGADSVGDIAGGVNTMPMVGDVATAFADGGQVESDNVSATPTQGPQSKVGQMFNNYTAPSAAPAKAKGGGGNPLGGLGNLAGIAGKGLMSWGEHEALPMIGDFLGDLAGTVGGADLGSLGGAMAGGAADAIPMVGGAAAEGAVEAAPVMVAARGGKVPALLSPGERYLSPKEAQAAKQGKVDPMKAGKKVPGEPKVKGAKNSYQNDTVKASLEEGGLVLPRSVTESKNPQWAAHKFVQAHMMAHGGMIPKKGKTNA